MKKERKQRNLSRRIRTALLSVFLVGETDKPKLSIRFNIFQCVRHIEQGGYP